MMNPEIKKRWIEALNSDEYKQTKNRLKDSTGYCCLGVLTDLYVKEHNQEWKYYEESHIYYFNDVESGQREGTILPYCVVNWSGLEYVDPYFHVSNTDDVNYLTILNDEGYSFKQIAQIIEENF